jgi:hypothetical protein
VETTPVAMSAQDAMVAREEMEQQPERQEQCREGCGRVQRGGQRIRLSPSLWLSRSSWSSHCHLAAFLVSLAGGCVKVRDEDIGSGEGNGGGAALRGGDTNVRGGGDRTAISPV